MAGSPRQSHDVAIAYKALLVSSLTSDAKAVAACILDHFNKKTGQCDPSIGRIAALLGLSAATVKRATSQLCDASFFKKESHGGSYGRAMYSPQWSAFRSAVVDWDRRMRTGEAGEKRRKNPSDGGEKGSKMSPGIAQNCAVGGIRNEPLTHLNNPSYKPITLSLPSEYEEGKRLLSGWIEGKSEQTNEPKADATTGCEPVKKTWKAAHDAVTAAINRLDPPARRLMWEYITECGERAGMDPAVRAELKCAGAGLRDIDRRMKRHRLDTVEARNAATH